jgi:hypothetical protein
MKVFGLDFTSNPSRTKRLTLAYCKIEGTKLLVTKLECLNTERDGDFSRVATWLKDNFEGMVGIDFPFGLPLAAIQHFRWVPSSDISWSSVLDLIYESCPTLTTFQDTVEEWKRKDKRNNHVKVHLKRQTDQIAGSTVSSPLKVRDFPPIGSMFYVGARLLREANVCVHPVQISNSNRHVVEAYPALAVNRFVGDSKYKDQTGERKAKAETTRGEILRQLSEANIYGFQVVFENERDREDCVSDHAGDKLDSILCATQAAWASRNSWGIPAFSLPSLENTVSIEGWIADPTLYCHFRSGEHEA